MVDQGPASLASAIERRRQAIQERWLERVRTELNVSPSSATGIHSVIERYLLIIADALRGGNGRERNRVQYIEDSAREHALARIRTGFDVEHVVHELSLLRRTVLEVLRDDGVAMTLDAAEKITETVELATVASMKNYMEARDSATRKVQAEHVGSVAHELRGPLAAAAMSIEIFRRMGVPSEQHRRMLDRLHRNFQRATQLTEELLHAGRLEAVNVVCQFSETTMGAIVDDLVEISRQAAANKGCEFTASYDPALRVVVDPELTRTTLESLLDNAVKYTDHGVIRLVVDEISTEISVHVRDSCAGLAGEDLAAIFEPFQRGNNGKPGTGLGLSIARRAVEAQGGSIHAESGNGGGCHFWFTLPKRNGS